MARDGMKNTMMLFMKPSIVQKGFMISVNERSISKLVDELNPTAKGEPRLSLDDPPTSCWFPHPRSGIYFPEGQERIMDDVPEHAATMDQTIWLRNVDGVDDVDKQESFTAATDVTQNNPK